MAVFAWGHWRGPAWAPTPQGAQRSSGLALTQGRQDLGLPWGAALRLKPHSNMAGDGAGGAMGPTWASW